MWGGFIVLLPVYDVLLAYTCMLCTRDTSAMRTHVISHGCCWSRYLVWQMTAVLEADTAFSEFLEFSCNSGELPHNCRMQNDKRRWWLHTHWKDLLHTQQNNKKNRNRSIPTVIAATPELNELEQRNSILGVRTWLRVVNYMDLLSSM